MGSLWRRKAKNVALGGGLTFAVALVAAALFLSDALQAEAQRARGAMPDVTVEALVAGRPSTIPVASAEPFRAYPSVRSVVPRVWGYIFLPGALGNLTLVGTPSSAPALSEAHGELAGGRDLVAGAHEMIAGVGLTSLLGLKLGDQVGFPSRRPDASPLRLVGTFSSSVDLYTSDVVLCDEADARAILGLEEGQATDLAVWVTNPSESHVIATKITAKLPGSRVIEKQLLGRIYALTFGRRAGLVLAATVPALIALLVLAWDRASGLGPDEKREIGVLKAVGWSTTDVLNAKLLEAFLVSAMAASIGLALGYLWVFVLDAPGLRATLSGWSTLYPTVHLTPAVDLAELLALALAIVAPFVGLSIVPAWRAATMDPMEAMRG